MDKKGWVRGQPNVHVCPRDVGRWFIQCPHGHFIYYSNQIKDVKFFVGEALLFYINQNYNIFLTHLISTSQSRYTLSILGGDLGRWSVSECPRGQRVGGQLNVHVCPLGGVGE